MVATKSPRNRFVSGSRGEIVAVYVSNSFLKGFKMSYVSPTCFSNVPDFRTEEFPGNTCIYIISVVLCDYG